MLEQKFLQKRGGEGKGSAAARRGAPSTSRSVGFLIWDLGFRVGQAKAQERCGTHQSRWDFLPEFSCRDTKNENPPFSGFAIPHRGLALLGNCSSSLKPGPNKGCQHCPGHRCLSSLPQQPQPKLFVEMPMEGGKQWEMKHISPTSPLADSFQWCPVTGQGAMGTN